MNRSTPGLHVHHHSQSSLRLTSIKSVMPSSHLILCHPLLLLPPIPPSIRVFSNESTHCMRWPKYWSFSFSIIPSKEIPGLIFRMDWLDLLALQGTLKSLLQDHIEKHQFLSAQPSSQSNSHIPHQSPLNSEEKENRVCLVRLELSLKNEENIQYQRKKRLMNMK